MYTLVWDKEKFDVQKERFVPAAGGMPAGAASGGGLRTSAGRIDYAAWKRFVDQGRLDGPAIDPVLGESWRRCRERGVDPAPRKCWDIVPLARLEPSAGRLRELTREVEREVYSAIRGRNLLITITDAQGYVVRTCGDLSTLRAADKLNFGPGANWAEDSVGTNAIGTALASGRPMQVFGEEHYCRSHHAWRCTAAPIFDPHGNIFGCFDISGPAGSDHSRTLPLVIGAARSLEKRLIALHGAELSHQSCALVSAVFNAVLTGILSVDNAGRIQSANSAAEALLGLPADSLAGRPADEVVEFDAFLARQKHPSSRAEAVPLACRVNPGLVARATPVFSMNGTWFGTVVTLVEPQRTMPPRLAPAKAPPAPMPAMSGVVGTSPALRQAVAHALRAARTPSTVLLTGESGTGKELFAKGIHQAGPRAAGPFVAMNCGALASELIQSELFGYVGGAFTGADRKGRAGRFELADKGTLFLDEIAEMPLALQVNLLRVIEERKLTRVGGSQSVPVEVKIVAATNRDLAEEVAAGRFRRDLYYRLNVVAIRVPPLRERGGDVRLLAEHHARRLAAEFGIALAAVSPEVFDLLAAHDWPGNVRELVNALEYALNTLDGETLTAAHLPPYLRKTFERGRAELDSFSLKEVEAKTIREALAHHGGNVTHAARALGIGRNTLYAKLRQLGLAG